MQTLQVEDENTAQDARLKGQQPEDDAPAETETQTNQTKADSESLTEPLKAKREFYNDSNFYEDNNAWISKTVRVMQWLLWHAEGSRKPKIAAGDKNGEKGERQIAITDFKPVTWKEWLDSKGPVTETHFAIYLLSEEPPARFTRASLYTQTKSPTQSVERDTKWPAGQNIPSRIRIRSLPVIRILHGLCNRKLNHDIHYGLVILRPFKIFEYLEQEIRDKLEELRQARYDYGPQAKSLAPETSNGDSKATASTFNLETIFKHDTDWTSLTFDEKDEAARDFELLVSFIDQYLVPLRKSLRSASEVSFADLWHLFSPGSLIYVKDKTVPQKVWRVIQGTGGRRNMAEPSPSDRLKLGAPLGNRCNPFVLDCYYIDWNGNQYIRIHKRFDIEDFSDLQAITSLPILPYNMAQQERLINRDELLERAAQFIECTKSSYRYYSGRSMNVAPDGHKLRQPDPYGSITGTVMTLSEHVESPVMIDFERGLQSIPDWAPDFSELSMSATPREELAGDSNDTYSEDDRVWDVRIAERVLGLKNNSLGWEKQGSYLSDDDKLLLPARVIAFVFRTRRWGKLFLS